MTRALTLLVPLLALAADSVPRPEYPQPQFRRAPWLSLNGSWEFEVDDQNIGLTQNWHQSAGQNFSRSILVPFCFESKASGIGDTSFHPWVWYKRTFAIPREWSGHRTLLHFGAVDYRARVWVNGRLAAEHEGGNTHFQLDITHLLNGKINTVVVRAEDPPTDRYIPRGKQFWEPKSRSIFYTRTSGIWQSVWLEATGDSYLEKLRVTPSLDGRVRIEAKSARSESKDEMRATVLDGGNEIAAGTARITGGAFQLELNVRNPKLWSPAAPNLYSLSLDLLRAGQIRDHVDSYFGIRTIRAEGGRLYLNNRPITLKMVLDQGYWPESILTPPSEQAILFDIQAAKELGFNGARKHQKVEDPLFLYHADRQGFLVSGEMANAQDYDEDYAGRFTREWLDVVERDYNHPSIIMWVPINESWGVPDLASPRQQAHLKSLYWLTRSLDATRLVIDNDGWEHVDTMDAFTIHDYAATGDKLYEKYKDIGKPGARVPDNGRAIFAPGYCYNGSPFLLSEFGGIAYIPDPSKVPKESWGYSGVEKTSDLALARLRGLFQAISRIRAFTGYCYTQLTDVEQEVNGLLTYDRKKKFDPAAIREMNALVQ